MPGLRRSQAPSARGLKQRPNQAPLHRKFAPKVAVSKGVGKENSENNDGVQVELKAAQPIPTPAPVFGKRKREASDSVVPLKRKRLAPLHRAPAPVATTEEQSGPAAKKVYECMHMKRSNKKHKTFDGDGFLILEGAKVSLVDMDGKVISKTTLHKEEDRIFSEGQMLYMGMREAEIGAEVPLEKYSSGEAFLQNFGKPSSTSHALQTPRKRFSAFKKHAGLVNKDAPREVAAPSHDPDAEDALVLFRAPKNLHSKGPPLVSVVVDPYLARHLRPHQRSGVKFIYDCLTGKRGEGEGAILADEMGLGKTVQTIAVLYTLLKQGERGVPVVKKAVIITPSSLIKNWVQEIKKWLGDERLRPFALVDTAKGEATQAIRDFASSKSTKVLIISYEMFVKHKEKMEAIPWGLIMCDEGHRLKNANIKTTRCIASLRCNRRLILTGTPVQNDLSEFHAMMSFVNPGVLGPLTWFKRFFEAPIQAARERGRSEALRLEGKAKAEELMRKTSAFVLRRTHETMIKYLPPRHMAVLFCKMTLQQEELTDIATRNLKSSLVSGPSGLAGVLLLKKLCNHPILAIKRGKKTKTGDDEEGALSSTADVLSHSVISESFPEGCSTSDASLSGKMKVAQGMLRCIKSETDDKVVVVSNYTQTLDLFATMCKENAWKYVRLDGSVPTGQRMPIVNRFNNSKHDFVFLLSARAGGVGLNLVGANRLILFDPDWNPATDHQAMARVWRMGQKKPVHIYRLLTTGSIEEKIWQRQMMKESLSSAVVDDTSVKAHFTIAELRNLYTYNYQTDCDTHEKLACECGGMGPAISPLEEATADGEDVNANDAEVPADEMDFTFELDELLADETFAPSSLREAEAPTSTGAGSDEEKEPVLSDDEEKEPAVKEAELVDWAHYKEVASFLDIPMTAEVLDSVTFGFYTSKIPRK